MPRQHKMLRAPGRIVGAAVLLLTASTSIAWADGAAPAGFPGRTRTPSIYQVTVTKVELCQSGTSLTNDSINCVNSSVVGSGSTSFDIASAAAGAQVGRYASIPQVNPGLTYTHVKVTLSTTWRMQAVSGGWKTFNTTTGTTADGTGGGCYLGKAGTSGTDFGGVSLTPSTTAVSLVAPDPDQPGGVTTASYNSLNFVRKAGASELTYLRALSSPYTLKGGRAPTIKVSFDVQDTVAVFYTGGVPGVSVCNSTLAVYALPPQPTITITD